MLYCYFTDSPFETVRLMANYLTISILILLDTQLSRHVDLPKSKALLRHIKWTLREILHVLFYASTLSVGIHALINVHEYYCIAIRMRCWLMDACSPILCCSVGNIYARLA